MWTSSVIENTHIIHDYMANSLPRDSDQMRRIQAAVKKAGMFVVLGYSERDGGKWETCSMLGVDSNADYEPS